MEVYQFWWGYITFDGFFAFKVPGGRWPGGQVDFNFGQDYINFLGDI